MKQPTCTVAARIEAVIRNFRIFHLHHGPLPKRRLWSARESRPRPASRSGFRLFNKFGERIVRGSSPRTGEFLGGSVNGSAGSRDSIRRRFNDLGVQIARSGRRNRIWSWSLSPRISNRSAGRAEKLSLMCGFWRWGGICGCASGGVGCGGFFQLADTFFHFLAGFERNHPFLRDIHPFAGSRISRLAGRSFLDLKDSEVPKFDPMIGDERLDNGLERLLNDLFGLELRQTNLFRNRFHDFFFGHVSSLPREMRPDRRSVL